MLDVETLDLKSACVRHQQRRFFQTRSDIFVVDIHVFSLNFIVAKFGRAFQIRKVSGLITLSSQ